MPCLEDPVACAFAERRALLSYLLSESKFGRKPASVSDALVYAFEAGGLHNPGKLCSYLEQTDWRNSFRDIEWSAQPTTPTLPVYKEVAAKPQILIAHLFSGRRRDQDFHMRLHNWAELHGCNVVVLSLDTAVSPYYGNLFHESVIPGRDFWNCCH